MARRGGARGASLATLTPVTQRRLDHLTRLAHEHLDDGAAERWLGLLRPAVQLVPAGPGDPVIARLGGTPALPEGTPWPKWPGNGPLSFVVEVDLDALAAGGLDPGLALATEGRLLGFYFDDPEGTGAIVYAGDPGSRAGARLLHVTGTPPSAGSAVELTGRQVLTWPGWEHPVLELLGLKEVMEPFDEVLTDLLEEELPDAWGHQVGGWAQPVQGPVELEAATTRLGEASYDEAHVAEAMRWRPLVQVDSDEAAGTSWGDAGCLYWLVRTDGSTPPDPADPDEIAFTWQCG
nr:YwqG family protein [Nocardioides ochotonae]